MRTKKNEQKFQVGDRVQFPYGPQNVFGTVVEDRGNLAAGKRLFRILFDFDETTLFTELAEDEMKMANGGETTKNKRKNGQTFKVGDRVQMPYRVQNVFGTIVEDRGNLAGGKRLWSVKVEFGEGTFITEVPEYELTAVK